MPELPEVEHLRRSIDPWLCGARVTDVEVLRSDVVRVVEPANLASNPRSPKMAATLPHLLGRGAVMLATDRRGKQMAVHLDSGSVIIIQLGMTGSLRIERHDLPLEGPDVKHRHVVWAIEPGLRAHTPTDVREFRWRVSFRDPRRFGGITILRSADALARHWKTLGPDALDVSSAALHAALSTTKRPIKAALLDQGVVAGVGNIYADEALFRAEIHPLRAANSLQRSEATKLARSLRSILAKAVIEGGSTLRDYRDAFGESGRARQLHAAYGRGGLPCVRCGTVLVQIAVTARTTVYCPQCQRGQPPTYPQPIPRHSEQ
jgi:formamidopyrimidine-DNA glycosylase